MLQIRLSNKATASETGKLPSGETVTVACPDHLVLAELPVAKSLGYTNGVTPVKTVGRRSRRPLGERVHFCVQCDFPIAIYGRLIPCEHAFCLDCARSDSLCYLCDDRIQKIQTIKMMEGIFICAAPHCLKSFLKKSDFEAHVHAVHADLINSNPQKDVNESEAASTKKPTTSDSTVQAPTPRPVQDSEDRTPRPQPQPPVRPLIQPNPNPPHGFDGPTPMQIQQQNFEYPMNTLQPPNFVLPVNPHVMGPGLFGQPLYPGQQASEAGVEQGSLLGYPQPWNVGPNGVLFDPSMMMNQGGFFQGGPPSNIPQGGNANPSLPPPPPPLPPAFAQIPGNFYGGGDSSHHGQGPPGYSWPQDKRDGFGNGQD
uniref:E3 ubiquitin-protein ligase HAKAI homolog n=1 Tax=Erigeron canadensis TaxID=72917 RepID=UPI001CB8B8AA|nr:E3 ubiquitin-protein ligase HAKAI homolog [Erigeron canadensis]XP_043609878.1 E3 ubiquitin-protein ligase HAKAI homolog [Erigeron canadensis]